MSQLEVTQRILCAEAKVDATRVRNGKLSEADWSKIHHAVGRLANAQIFIDDNPNITVMDIRAKARRLKSRIGDLGVVIVDYIQLMSGRMSAENRQVEVAEISRNLKILARELECPVVALAQLNRQLETRADKRPMLADLRESGSIEQDADVVMFLYRDEVYNPEALENKGTAEILVAKHRSGPTGQGPAGVARAVRPVREHGPRGVAAAPRRTRLSAPCRPSTSNRRGRRPDGCRAGGSRWCSCCSQSSPTCRASSAPRRSTRTRRSSPPRRKSSTTAGASITTSSIASRRSSRTSTRRCFA